MLTITESAGGHLTHLLDEAQAPDDMAVRFVLAGEGLSMQLDRPQPEDATFEHNGRTVLLLDESISQALDDKTLDLHETEKGPTLALS